MATADVQVYSGDALVTAERVPNFSTYRVVLPPGQYYVTNSGTPESGMGLSVTVSKGGTTRADIPDMCD